jgi:hypothetical protein
VYANALLNAFAAFKLYRWAAWCRDDEMIHEMMSGESWSLQYANQCAASHFLVLLCATNAAYALWSLRKLL